MSDLPEVFQLVNELYLELQSIGVTKVTATNKALKIQLFNELITEPTLRKKTEKLFKDGHHAQAVEVAYKLLDNMVKKRSGLASGITGASLMQTVFSSKNPILRLNENISASEKDEQLGYMNIFSGCMTGIRNPRAHESDWEDTEERALQLLVFANHLIERVLLAVKEENTK